MNGQICMQNGKEAKEEGFDHIAYLFEGVGKIEKEHEARYLKLLENVKNGKCLKEGDKIWKCRNCGHIVLEQKLQKFAQYVQSSTIIFLKILKS